MSGLHIRKKTANHRRPKPATTRNFMAIPKTSQESLKTSCDFSMETDSREASGMAAKVALVTGSTSGIGLEISRLFARRGCSIILTGFAEQDLINKLREEFTQSYGVRLDYIAADLRNISEIEQLCQRVHELHPRGVDVLVNNAGFNHVAHVTSLTDAHWDEMIAVMLSAPFHLIKRLSPYMQKKKWGRIINMSSQMGLISALGKSGYSAVKHGIIGLTKGVALDLGSDGITCNAVCPSFCLSTPLMVAQIEALATAERITYKEAVEKIKESMPVKQDVSPSQIAELVDFLCFSDAAAVITGVPYLIDGGFTAK